MEIARRLSWPEEKALLFVAEIQKQGLQAPVRRPSAAKGKAVDFREMELDTFRFIADLNHSTVLTLVQSRKVLELARISSLLGIPKIEAELIVSRLIRLGLATLEKKGVRASNQSLEIKSVPSEAIRAFHREAIRRAEESIEGQAPPLRNLAGLTLSLDPQKMAEAKTYLNKFLKNFERKFGNAEQGRIYQLNTQLFGLEVK